MTLLLTEFSQKKLATVSFAFHVDDRSESLKPFKLIIGQDILGELETMIIFNNNTTLINGIS
jgi:hypothetical protein